MFTFCLAGSSSERPAFGDIEELRIVDVTEKKGNKLLRDGGRYSHGDKCHPSGISLASTDILLT